MSDLDINKKTSLIIEGSAEKSLDDAMTIPMEKEPELLDNRIIYQLIKDYEDDTKNFKLISVNKIHEMINKGDSFYLYVGRVTCDRLFVPTLNQYALDNSINIFYLDSSDTDINVELKTFRETNGIETVPALLYNRGENGLIKIEIDVTSNEFDINMLKNAIEHIL